MFTNKKRTLVLLIDRKEDPITPLLNQWTYQAMLHELLGIGKNRIKLRGEAEQERDLAKKEFVVSTSKDTFLSKNVYANFGELASNVKEFIEHVSTQKQKDFKIESLCKEEKSPGIGC